MAHIGGLTNKQEGERQRAVSQKRLLGSGYSDPKKIAGAFNKEFGLVTSYVSSLNRASAMQAREAINKQKLFMKVMSFNESQKTLQQTSTEHYYRKARLDYGHAPPKTDYGQKKKFGQAATVVQPDPAMAKIIGNENRLKNAMLRDFLKKLASNATRVKSNFKGCNYDLDERIAQFMEEREERDRLAEAAKKLTLTKSNSVKETMTKEDRRKEAVNMRENVFRQFPMRECIFDDDLVALCSGEVQRLTQVEYAKLIRDENRLDQLTILLVSYKRELNESHIKDLLYQQSNRQLLYILPKISTFEFASFRDGKIDLHRLKCKVMNISEGVLMSKAELIKAGVQPEFFKGYYDEQLAAPPRSSIVDPEKIKRSRKKLNKAASLVVIEQADIEKLKTKANLRKFKKMPTLLLPQNQMSAMQANKLSPSQGLKEIPVEKVSRPPSAKPKESARQEEKKVEPKPEPAKKVEPDSKKKETPEPKQAVPKNVKNSIGRDQEARLKAARDKRYREYKNLIELKFLQRLQNDGDCIVHVNPKDQQALDKAHENVDFGYESDRNRSADDKLRKKIPTATFVRKPRPRDIMWSAAKKRRLLPDSVLDKQGLLRAKSGNIDPQQKESARQRPKTAGRNARLSGTFGEQLKSGSNLIKSAERLMIDADDLQSLQQSGETIEEDLNQSPRRKTFDNRSSQDGFEILPLDQVKTQAMGSHDNTNQSSYRKELKNDPNEESSVPVSARAIYSNNPESLANQQQQLQPNYMIQLLQPLKSKTMKGNISKVDEQSEDNDTVILENRSLQTSALNNEPTRRTNDSGQAHQLKFSVRPQSSVPLSSRIQYNRKIPHTAYDTMKSTNRNLKEKQSHIDNYSTSISSMNRAKVPLQHHNHRHLSSSKDKTRSKTKQHEHKSNQGSPFRNNISMSSINVSDKFMHYIHDLGIPVNVRSQLVLKNQTVQGNSAFCTGFGNQDHQYRNSVQFRTDKDSQRMASITAAGDESLRGMKKSMFTGDVGRSHIHDNASHLFQMSIAQNHYNVNNDLDRNRSHVLESMTSLKSFNQSDAGSMRIGSVSKPVMQDFESSRKNRSPIRYGQKVPDANVDITGARIDLKRQFSTAKPSGRPTIAKKNTGRLLREYEITQSVLYSEPKRNGKQFTTASTGPQHEPNRVVQVDLDQEEGEEIEREFDLEDTPLNYYHNVQFKQNGRYIPVPVTVQYVKDQQKPMRQIHAPEYRESHVMQRLDGMKQRLGSAKVLAQSRQETLQLESQKTKTLKTRNTGQAATPTLAFVEGQDTLSSGPQLSENKTRRSVVSIQKTPEHSNEGDSPHPPYLESVEQKQGAGSIMKIEDTIE